MTTAPDHEAAPTATQRAEITARAEALLERRTNDRFRELVLAWAAAEDGSFPTRAEAYVQAREELEVLCAGLGRWAALPPHEVFPTGLFPVRLPPPDEEVWW